jgi:hypothetical protein
MCFTRPGPECFPNAAAGGCHPLRSGREPHGPVRRASGRPELTRALANPKYVTIVHAPLPLWRLGLALLPGRRMTLRLVLVSGACTARREAMVASLARELGELSGRSAQVRGQTLA